MLVLIIFPIITDTFGQVYNPDDTHVVHTETERSNGSYMALSLFRLVGFENFCKAYPNKL